MPSFFSRSMQRQQLPPTPPEFVPSSNSSCGGAQYQQPYGGQPAVMHNEDMASFAERYDHSAMLSGPTQAYFAHIAQQSHYAYPPPSYHEVSTAPMLPPMHSTERTDLPSQIRRSMEQQAKAQKSREEKPTGGVSSELDYEMDTMTEFVGDVAQRIVMPSQPFTASTRKWIHSVLSATRLPSSTIIMGMYYMSRRMTQLRESGQARGPDVQLTRMITLALLLGSKFLDDNTFINRSWAEVSGITVQDLNRLEKEWLAAFEFRLHIDPSQGFDGWKAQWQEFETQSIAKASRQAKLAPIDTSVNPWEPVAQHLNKGFSANTPYSYGFGKLPTPEYTQKPQLSQYNPPPYTHSDHAWGMSRSAIDMSPPSAATPSGPTTPEYYNAHNVWGPPEGYSRRTMFGYPPVSQTQVHSQHAQSHLGFHHSGYSNGYHHSVWNNHGMHCNCFQCMRQHRPYMMPSEFQTVMG